MDGFKRLCFGMAVLIPSSISVLVRLGKRKRRIGDSLSGKGKGEWRGIIIKDMGG